jgi:peroxiredoxin
MYAFFVSQSERKEMRMKKRLAVAKIRLTLGILSLASLAIIAASLVPTVRGQGLPALAPNFELTDLTGKMVSLSDYKGKVLFLNFWATWCPPCRAEIPDFVEAYQENKAKGLEIIGISLDINDRDAVVSFVEKYKINYPIVLESRSTTQQLIDDYRPGQFIPTTIVIDKQGRIRRKQVGQMNKRMLLSFFNELAAERP